MDESRLVYIHAWAPPTPGGTPVVLQRLLTNLPGVRVDVVTDRALRRRVRAGGNRVLDADYRFVWKWPGWGSGSRAGQVAVAAIDLLLAAVAGLRTAIWARRGRANWIMSVTDEGFSVITGAIAGRLAGIPHVVMVFDLWEENAYNPIQRAIARRLERRIFRSAAKVVGYCEETAAHYRAKHGIAASFIRTPIELADVPEPTPRPESAEREVLLAGAVYWVQRDAVARLLSLRGSIGGVRMSAIGNERSLHQLGLTADSYEAALPSPEFARRLERADVLFIGLSFFSEHPEVVLTGTPARFVDAMATRRPLLIHAPPNSHVASYARREDLAEVVDVPEAEALLSGLRTVLDDSALTRERVSRARRIVEERHDVAVVRADFVRLLRELETPAAAGASLNASRASTGAAEAPNPATNA
jgi:glycosyl transferase family 4